VFERCYVLLHAMTRNDCGLAIMATMVLWRKGHAVGAVNFRGEVVVYAYKKNAIANAWFVSVCTGNVLLARCGCCIWSPLVDCFVFLNARNLDKLS
jgi:hypothetical protein